MTLPTDVRDLGPGFSGWCDVVTAVTIHTDGGIPIATSQHPHMGTIAGHLELSLVTGTAGFIDGQGHLPMIGIWELYP